MESGMVELWLWEVPDERRPGKRRVTRYRMTERDALERFGGDAVKVPGSLEVRQPVGGTSTFQAAPPKQGI